MSSAAGRGVTRFILGAVTPAPYAVPPGLPEAFRRDGHALLTGLVSMAELPAYGSASPGAGVSGDDLDAVAAALLGVPAVVTVERRLEWVLPRSPIGPWQRDADRLGGDRPLVTMWLPLQECSVDLGTPQYASGTVSQEASDQFLAGLGTDPDRSHPVDSRYPVTAVVPLAAGDASFHGGWTAYRIFGNTTQADRFAAVVTWAPPDRRRSSDASTVPPTVRQPL